MIKYNIYIIYILIQTGSKPGCYNDKVLVEDDGCRMDFGSPPSFNGLNFEEWSLQMEMFLHCEGLWNFILHGYDDPHEEEREALDLCFIQQAMDNGILYFVVEAINVKEA